MEKIIILGASGMLGSMILDYFSKQRDIDLTATVRNDQILSGYSKLYPKVRWQIFNALSNEKDVKFIKNFDYVINAIGITKSHINEDNVDVAIKINSDFPFTLQKQIKHSDTKVIQIATDCVFSGIKGNYIETDYHDAIDVYGKSKSLGEVKYNNYYNIRCSFIGPEPKEHKALFDWFKYQPKNETINGFINHKWNGITTLHVAKICFGIIKNKYLLSSVQHIVPKNEVTKYELLKIFSLYTNRGDINIKKCKNSTNINRVLNTKYKENNRDLWLLAGYNSPPTIEKMIQELVYYQYNLSISV